jgi:type IV pilus assembly protein PilA
MFRKENNSMQNLRQRLSRDEGFTLIELLVVIVIIGILLAIAVPSYLGFRDRANNRAAEANVRAGIPAAEAFYSDNGTYVGLNNPATGNPKGISSYDSGLKATVAGTPTATAYCLTSTVGGQNWSVAGPGSVWHKSADCSGAVATP